MIQRLKSPFIKSKDNVRAIILLVFSMGMFSVEDALIKLATQHINSGQAIFLICLISGLIFFIYAWLKGEIITPNKIFERAFLIRNLSEVVAVLAIVTALSLIPLSLLSAILQTAPLIVTLGAALFLAEPVGWRRWTAVTIGLLGVLIIIRPGFDSFDINALFALIGAFGLAIRDLSTRYIPKNMPTSIISATAILLTVIPSFLLMIFQGGWQPLAPITIFYLGSAIFIGIFATIAIVIATRIGQPSAIAQYRYSRLLFGIIIGYLVFNERPDALTYLGSALIVGMGLYTFHRERIRRQN